MSLFLETYFKRTEKLPNLYKTVNFHKMRYRLVELDFSEDAQEIISTAVRTVHRKHSDGSKGAKRTLAPSLWNKISSCSCSFQEN